VRVQIFLLPRHPASSSYAAEQATELNWSQMYVLLHDLSVDLARHTLDMAELGTVTLSRAAVVPLCRTQPDQIVQRRVHGSRASIVRRSMDDTMTMLSLP